MILINKSKRKNLEVEQISFSFKKGFKHTVIILVPHLFAPQVNSLKSICDYFEDILFLHNITIINIEKE